ncbi:MAG: SRPBCC domain-containing protein [Pseudomonadota bacterium]|jgi:uncharacterized protein YndB with AHSA1/START domain
MKLFKTSKAIHASPQDIFDAFSNQDMLAEWWGPAGFTNSFDIFEFKNGGKWSFVMHGPDGRHYENESKFIEIIAAKKVVIYHVSEPKFTLTITIKDNGAGSTIHWAQAFENEELANNIAHIVEPSNEQNLNRLAAVVCAN